MNQIKKYEKEGRQNKNLELAATNTRYEKFDTDQKSISSDNIPLNDRIINYFEDNKEYWYINQYVDELKFAILYLHIRPLIYYKQFYDIDGAVNIQILKRDLIGILQKYLKSSKLLKAADNIIEFLKTTSYVERYVPSKNTIHTLNSKLVVNDNYEIEMHQKEIAINRLNVIYAPTSKEPKKWLAFLEELLITMDIEIFQEFLGYCLIASMETQKALLIIGKQGGEGKSTILNVLQKMFGKESMTQKNIHKMIGDKFGYARVNNKLVIYDDDMKPLNNSMLEPLKKFISLEEIEYEAKYSMEEGLYHYARFIGLGNNVLDVIKSDDTAFNRRLIVLNVKPKSPNRIDNPKLILELYEEINEIFNWALEGLIRLLKNNFQFSYSNEMEARVSDILRDDSDRYIKDFLEDKDYVEYDINSETISFDLYDTYKKRCIIKRIDAVSDARFFSDLKRVCVLYDIKPKNKVGEEMRRGYIGIKIKNKEYLKEEKDTGKANEDNPF